MSTATTLLPFVPTTRLGLGGQPAPSLDGTLAVYATDRDVCQEATSALFTVGIPGPATLCLQCGRASLQVSALKTAKIRCGNCGRAQYCR